MSLAYNLYMDAISLLSRSDRLFPWVVKLQSLRVPRLADFLANEQTEIVIEGFPRSANTFFTSAFEVAQKRPVRIARHLHRAYQIRFAERHQLPAVILIRNPLDAIASAILRDPRSSAGLLFRDYRRFYKECLRVHSRSVVAPFEIATTDPNAIIHSVNRTFGTHFVFLQQLDHSHVLDNVSAKDRTALGNDAVNPLKSALPSEDKKIIIQDIKLSLVRDHPDYYQECMDVYYRILQLSVLHDGPRYPNLAKD